MDLKNNFGLLSTEYKKARRGYPPEVYEYIKSLVTKKNPFMLDLGCGTGISTRELKEYGFDVIGVDKDTTMIKLAQGEKDDISYIVAPANHTPFPNDYFDMVVAFTAFHWFNDQESLSEIKRILKPGGLFFAALKGNHKTKETEKMNKEYLAILEKYAGSGFDSTHKHFDKSNLEALFENITEKSFIINEKYTIEDALTLLRSLSFWNLVPENSRQNFLAEIQQFYENHFVEECIIKQREIFTIAAWKKT